jgi:hypothetical protein
MLDFSLSINDILYMFCRVAVPISVHRVGCMASEERRKSSGLTKEEDSSIFVW